MLRIEWLLANFKREVALEEFLVFLLGGKIVVRT